MRLLSRFKKPASSGTPVTDAIARQIADLVTAGRVDEADALAKSTNSPAYAALASFRYIDAE